MTETPGCVEVRLYLRLVGYPVCRGAGWGFRSAGCLCGRRGEALRRYGGFVVVLLFGFLGPYPQHMEVPRLSVESEMQFLAYTTATATQDPNRVCDLYCSSRQCWILNPLSGVRDGTCILMVISQVLGSLSLRHKRNSEEKLFSMKHYQLKFFLILLFFAF